MLVELWSHKFHRISIVYIAGMQSKCKHYKLNKDQYMYVIYCTVLKQ